MKDLAAKLEDPAKGKKHGVAGVYTDARGTKVPCTDATFYAHRDDTLREFNAVEFDLVFEPHRLSVKDMEDFRAEWAKMTALGFEAGVGRPKLWCPLKAGHSLAESHVMAAHAKWGLPAFAGRPPPKRPKVGSGSACKVRKAEREFALYYYANFVPWSVDEPLMAESRDGRCFGRPSLGALDEVVQDWKERALGPEDDAARCQPSKGWGSEDKRLRNLYHGRVTQLERLQRGFSVNREHANMCSKCRMRSRTLWKGGDAKAWDDPMPGGLDAGQKEAAAYLAKTAARATALDGSELVQRLNAARKTEAWGKRLVSALPSKLGSDSAGSSLEVEAAGPVLRTQWRPAAQPAERTSTGLVGGTLRAKEVSAGLRQPLPPRGIRSGRSSFATGTGLF